MRCYLTAQAVLAARDAEKSNIKGTQTITAAFLFVCWDLWVFGFAFLGLGELFLESGGFSKGAWSFFRLRTEVSDGQGRCPCTLQGALAP